MPVLDEPVEAVPDADPSEVPFSAGIPPDLRPSRKRSAIQNKYGIWWNLSSSICRQNKTSKNVSIINHQVLILLKLNMHVMNIQPLVKHAMKSVLKASSYPAMWLICRKKDECHIWSLKLMTANLQMPGSASHVPISHHGNTWMCIDMDGFSTEAGKEKKAG